MLFIGTRISPLVRDPRPVADHDTAYVRVLWAHTVLLSRPGAVCCGRSSRKWLLCPDKRTCIRYTPRAKWISHTLTHMGIIITDEFDNRQQTWSFEMTNGVHQATWLIIPDSYTTYVNNLSLQPMNI